MQDDSEFGVQPPYNDISSVSWEASEYLHHDKDSTWLILLGAITVALSALSYWLMQDLFTIAVLVLLAVAVAIYAYRKPRTVSYQAGDDGIRVGNKLYDYSQFQSFSVVDEGAVKSIFLEPVKRILPPMTIYFGDEDEDKIVSVISAYLPFRKRELDFIDQLFRKLRF